RRAANTGLNESSVRLALGASQAGAKGGYYDEDKVTTEGYVGGAPIKFAENALRAIRKSDGSYNSTDLDNITYLAMQGAKSAGHLGLSEGGFGSVNDLLKGVIEADKITNISQRNEKLKEIRQKFDQRVVSAAEPYQAVHQMSKDGLTIFAKSHANEIDRIQNLPDDYVDKDLGSKQNMLVKELGMLSAIDSSLPGGSGNASEIFKAIMAQNLTLREGEAPATIQTQIDKLAGGQDPLSAGFIAARGRMQRIPDSEAEARNANNPNPEEEPR
ncbi:MAG TPA: hypothetical protein VII94_04030, partial [Candidatus Saccharimonadales bacterium]